MKQFLLFLLLLASFIAKAQIETPAVLYGKQENRITAKKAFKYPTGCGSPQGVIFPSVDSSQAAMYFDSCAHRQWNYDPALNKWLTGVAAGDLQATTDLGNLTTDTIIATGVRTKRLLPDTTVDADFEIDIFPDLQNMTYYAPADSRKMFNWVKNNRITENIQAVIGVGDITNFNTTAEWDTTHAQWGILDAIGNTFPYVAVVGNHDYGNGFNPAPRDATNYKVRFGPSRYASKPWYKGYYGPASENFYTYFEVGRKKFFVIALEFLPRDAVLTWAGNLCDSLYTVDPNIDVMITTHAYQSWTNQLAVDTTVYSGATYGMSADNDGQEMWSKFIKKKPNIKFVFNGHFIVFNYNYATSTQDPSPAIGLTGHIQATGENGNLVNQLYVNYQDDTAGGQGYFMRMKFHPTTNKVDVSFFSAVKNANDNRASLQPYTIDEHGLEIKNSFTSTGIISAEGDIRAGGFLKSEALKNRQVAYVGTDHRLVSSDSMAYYDKETNGVKAGLYVKPKITTDTLHIDVQADFNDKAYAVWRAKRTSPTGINLIADLTDTTASTAPSAIFGFQNSTKYPNPPIFDMRSSFNANANVPQLRNLGTCETCPGGRYYTYNEIFLADNANVGTISNLGDVQYWSRQQIRGGSSSVNRAHTTSLEMNGYVSQLFVVGNVDTLGKFYAFRDKITSFSQGNAVKEYYSFSTDNGYGNHIRSWGFYQSNVLQRNFFKGQTMIGDSTVANAGSSKLFVDGGVRFRNLPAGVKTHFLMVDPSNGDVYAADSTGLTGGGGGGGTGITSLNGLIGSSQTFATGTSGSDFGINSSGSAHTFNLPTASASNRGLLSTTDWTTFNGKQSSILTDAHILVGNGSNVATDVAVTGDVTITNAGVTAIGASKVLNSMVNSVAWSKITSTPTTIAGYGITDFNSLGDARWSLLAHTHTFASLTSKPTDLAGYGITDGANVNLSNLSSVAINTSLLPTTDNSIDLGSASKQWRDLYLTGASVYMGGTKVLSDAGLLIKNGGGLKTNTTAGHTALLQAYDVDGAAYTTFATLTANNTPTMDLSSSVTAATQSSADNSTKIATTAFVTTAVSNAVAAVNPAVAVEAATTANVSGYTYNNGVSGVGATLTQNSASAVTIDGYTLVLNDRVLFKNQTVSENNGVYVITTLGTGVIPAVFTRASDYNQSSDITNTGAIPVINGTVNATTSWLLTSAVNTVGTDPLTYVQFTYNPSTLITTTTSAGGDFSGTYPNPQIGSGVIVNADINASAAIDATKINTGAVTNTEFNYLDGVTSALQTQINGKQASGSYAVTTNNLSDLSNAGTARTNLGATTVGGNIFTLTNPSAIRWVRINADNTVTARTAAETLSDIGAQASGSYAVTTNNLSDLANAGTARTNLGATTLGGNIFTLTNPSALGYIRANADNTVTHRSYANVKVDLSLDAVENTALSTWAGTANITTLGTIATGTWSATTIALNKGGTGSTTAAGARANILPTITGNALKILRVNAGETDYELAAAGGGSGTVTNTGNLTSNAVVLGNGTVDTKVVAGITTDGTSVINLGVNTTTLGKVKMFGNTSGDATIQPAAIAGTATVVTLPNASSTLPIYPQQITYTGPTAARTITLPDAAFTVARTDAAQTFTGQQTLSPIVAIGTTTQSAIEYNTTSAALETTTEKGDQEVDANGIMYYSSAAAERGVIGSEQFVTITSANTLTSQTAVQPIFDGGGGPANGRITLAGSRSYFFEMDIDITAMSSTSGTFSLAFGGTATLTSIRYRPMAQKSSQTSINTVNDVIVTSAASTAVVGANTTVAGRVYVTGIIRVNAGGTLIPQIAFSTVAGPATPVITADSWIRLRCIGTNTVASVGNWD